MEFYLSLRVLIARFGGIMSALKNQRHEKFAKLYATHGNGARAARGAGFAAASSNREGSRLLLDPVIMARVQQLMAKDARLLSISKAEAIHEVSALATFNPADLYDDDGNLIPIQDLPRDVAASVREIKRICKDGKIVTSEVKAGGDKRAALDMALRIHNAYEEDNKGKGEVHIHLDEKDLQA